MRILALDIGLKKTGIAISNIEQTVIFPVSTIILKSFNGKLLFDALKFQIKNYWNEINTLVIGNAKNTDNKVNLNIYKFNLQVQKVFSSWTNWKIITIDENYSTCDSKKTLYDLNYSNITQNNLKDSFAALKILYDYFVAQEKNIIIAIK